MSKYKIGIIAKDILNKDRTGIENYTINLLNQFDKCTDFEFYLYTNHEYKNRFRNIHHVFIKNRKAWIHSVIYKQIKKDSIDLIFSPTPTLPIISNNNIKKVITVHDLFFKYMNSNINTTKLFFKNAILQSDKIIAVSEYTKSELLKLYKIDKSKISVIYEAYNKDLFTIRNKTKQNDSINILSVGTINKRKNFTQIVKIIPIIKDKFGDVKLEIIGKPGDDYDNLLNTIKDFKLENDVIISGYVTDADLAEKYANSDLFLYVSHEEGFGLPILEAFASGTPVVTSQNSATEEIGQNAAIIVDPNNLMDIADGVMEAIKRKADLTKLGLIEIEKFSWKKTADQTIDLFKELLK